MSHETSERKLGIVNSKETRLGRYAAEILLHAVSKQAIVDDLGSRIRGVSKAYGLIDGSKAGRDLYESLLLERAREEDKLMTRAGFANNIVSAHPELRLTNLDNPQQIFEGRLEAVDLRDATLELSDDKEHTLRVQFAENMPIPEGLHQTYYSHRLTVMMEVLSIPKEYEWVLK